MYKKLLLVTFIVTARVIFAVPHARMAFTIGTGVGLSGLQNQINKVQSRAINNNDTGDRNFDCWSLLRVGRKV